MTRFGCGTKAAADVRSKTEELTSFCSDGLRKGVMTVEQPGADLEKEPQGFGKIMMQNWLKDAGPNGRAIIDANQGKQSLGLTRGPQASGYDSCALRKTGRRGMMRRGLDALYLGAGALAAMCLVAILAIIVAQMICRWIGVSFPGSTAYAGYFMASASFLAFPYALNANSHIRVNLFLTTLGEHRYWAELWCYAVGSVATVWMAYYACNLVWWSWKLNDISQERDALPLWIPQLPVAFGAVLLAVCFVDNLVSLLVARKDNVDSSIGSNRVT